jgi:mRNA deadenylase 3'-5' endonuclease subunit Ccr4
MSYNVLADSQARSYRDELYRNVPEDLLWWPRRLRAILAEVRAVRPDILCMQECESFADVARSLKGDGYLGVHAPRAGGKKPQTPNPKPLNLNPKP